MFLLLFFLSNPLFLKSDIFQSVRMNLDKLRQFGNIFFVIKVILQFNLILWYIIFQFVVELQTAMRFLLTTEQRRFTIIILKCH